MRRKGVCYDVGRELAGRSWRPDFRPGEVRRELEIIAGDLHCTAVKLHGADLPRLGWTAQVALELGLEAEPPLSGCGPVAQLVSAGLNECCDLPSGRTGSTACSPAVPAPGRSVM